MREGGLLRQPAFCFRPTCRTPPHLPHLPLVTTVLTSNAYYVSI